VGKRAFSINTAVLRFYGVGQKEVLPITKAQKEIETKGAPCNNQF